MNGINSCIKAMSARFKMARRCFRTVRNMCLFLESKCVGFFLWVSHVTRTEFDLRNWINQHYDDFYLRRNYSREVAKVLSEKLIHLDVGARGGVLPVSHKYGQFFDIILCEPEPVEADRLQKKGYRVIPKALYRSAGKIILYETPNEAGSSIYRPQGPYLDFYNPDPAHIAQYDVANRTEISCSTIALELEALKIAELDFLKIDTQGAELDILMGLGNYRPLVMEVEVEYLPMYHDRPNAYQVCQHLYELGYIPFSLTSHHARTLCPTFGDGYFMPSWAHPKGLELIRAREEKYIALMLMFGQVKILQFVNEKIGLRNKGFVVTLNP